MGPIGVPELIVAIVVLASLAIPVTIIVLLVKILRRLPRQGAVPNGAWRAPHASDATEKP